MKKSREERFKSYISKYPNNFQIAAMQGKKWADENPLHVWHLCEEEMPTREIDEFGSYIVYLTQNSRGGYHLDEVHGGEWYFSNDNVRWMVIPK